MRIVALNFAANTSHMCRTYTVENACVFDTFTLARKL